MDERRIFSDKELGVLIKRATEIQDKAADTFDRGFSVEEIERIAARIGIEPEHLRAAISEIEDGGIGGPIGFFGGPFTLYEHRRVDGSLNDEGWQCLVLEMRRIMKSNGRASELGKMREWSRSFDDLERTRVTVAPEKDGSTIHIRQHFGVGATFFYLFLTVTGGALAMTAAERIGLPAATATMFSAGGAASAFVATRFAVVSWARRRRRSLSKLVSVVTESVARSNQIEEPQSDKRAIPGFDDETEPAVLPMAERLSV